MTPDFPFVRPVPDVLDRIAAAFGPRKICAAVIFRPAPDGKAIETRYDSHSLRSRRGSTPKIWRGSPVETRSRSFPSVENHPLVFGNFGSSSVSATARTTFTARLSVMDERPDASGPRCLSSRCCFASSSVHASYAAVIAVGLVTRENFAPDDEGIEEKYYAQLASRQLPSRAPSLRSQAGSSGVPCVVRRGPSQMGRDVTPPAGMA
jgi:hypothetical protein